MKRIYAALVLIGFVLLCHAKTDSVTINLSQLQYASDFEQKQFDALSKSGAFNPLLFLYCLDSTTTGASAAQFEQKLNTFFDEKLNAAAGKNNEKAIKAIFREIHDNLLSKYTTESRFERLLDKGEYNCVTASALYALAFERYHIPYQLRSTTSHVYVIANPGPDQLIIESTDPIGGAFKYSDAYKKSYIDLQLKQKMISKEEYNQATTEELFQKYFYTSDTINLKQLIGYHYYNDGLSLLSNEQYEPAVNQLKKAYYLNGNKQVTHVLYVALAGKIANSFDITNTHDLEYYFMFNKLGKETNLDALFNSYTLAAQDLLIRKDDLARFDSMSNTIFAYLDSADLKRFQEQCYYSLAYTYATKEDYLNAYLNTAKAYCINSKNVQVKALYDKLDKHIYFYLTEQLDEDSLEWALASIEAISKTCPAMKGKQWALQMGFMKAGILFNDEKISKGDEALLAAEKLLAANKDATAEDMYIEGAYEAAENYYYRKNEFARAKEYVLRGLKLVPESSTLKRALEYLNMRISHNYPSLPPAPYNRNYNTRPTPRTIIVKTPH
jgi:hypothetical protein